MNIILIGYRATGKTTVAKLLSEHLKWPWVDLDVEIEHRAGKTIAEIFAEEGEPAFRDRETEVVKDFCGRSGWIIAAGGGAPLRPENRQAMRQKSVVFWLTASPETIHQRMTTDPTTGARRPNLTARGGLEEIVELLARREPVYRETAHYVIDTENRSPQDVAQEVLRRLERLRDEKGAEV